MNLNALSVHEAQDLLRQGEITSLQLTEAALAQIEAVDESIHAYVTVTPEKARAQAQAADERLTHGGNAAPPLTGHPSRHQRRREYQGRPHHLLIAYVGELHSSVRRYRHGEA